MTQSRRFALPGLVALMLLAGCGSPSTQNVSPASSAAAVPKSSQPAGAPVQASPSAAVSAAAPASAPASSAAASSAAAGPIKIGLLEPLTGNQAALAKENLNGFNLYFASINNEVAGRPVQIIVADDQAAADVTLIKTRQLVDSDKVQMLAGYESTVEYLAALPFIKQSKIPTAITGNGGTVNLMVDPKLATPYVVRFTGNVILHSEAGAEWAYKQGYRKAAMVVSDYAGGLPTGDSIAAAFVHMGGTIVQEQYPPLSTADFGPFLAKLDPSADVLFTFIVGADGLRFQQQLGQYVQRKPPELDIAGAIINVNLNQLKDQALGLVYTSDWDQDANMPANQAFIKQYTQKYPGNEISRDAVEGYSGAMALAAAIQKVNGNVENTDAFLKALYATNIDTPKGHITLNADHDVIENIYFYQVVRVGDKFAVKVVQSINNVTSFATFGRDKGAKFPYGQLKGKWVGMTKTQLDQLANQ